MCLTVVNPSNSSSGMAATAYYKLHIWCVYECVLYTKIWKNNFIKFDDVDDDDDDLN